jgi:hypothetical protein
LPLRRGGQAPSGGFPSDLGPPSTNRPEGSDARRPESRSDLRRVDGTASPGPSPAGGLMTSRPGG